MSRFVDLSHIIENGMVTYEGLPAPVISDHLTREESRKHYGPGTEFHIGKIEMVANTGTYLDSPFHRYADGRDLSELPLESLAGLEGMVIRAPQVGEQVIGPEVLASRSVRGRAILFSYWLGPALEDVPVLLRSSVRIGGSRSSSCGGESNTSRDRLIQHR